MLYAKVNENGDIIDVATQQSDEYTLLVAPDNPVVAQLLEAKLDENSSRELLETSDQDMMRVLEDLIDLLSEKRIIQFTELPLAAQKKLLSRKWVRGIQKGHSDALIIENELDDDALI
ncbi:hypothetical protein ACFQ45_15950 [Rhodanobacter aciditrophus]|uniref:Tryptophan synthase subunit beta like protein n=1 Tax=Rhodanobacter aciditrophus TaxID=1623218 RepID=A0ABW4B406_9GAMM